MAVGSYFGFNLTKTEQIMTTEEMPLINSLERSNRWLRWGCALSLIVAVIGVCVGSAAWIRQNEWIRKNDLEREYGPEDGRVPAVIKAGRFEVVDKGQVVVRISAVQNAGWIEVAGRTSKGECH